MTTIFMEPGTDATQDLSMWSGSAGTCASDGTLKKTGSRSIKLTTTGSGDALLYRTGILVDAGRRITFWFRTDTVPAALSTFCFVLTAGFAQVFTVSLNTNMLLFWGASGTAPGAAGVQTLAINTWYRVSLAYVISSTTVFRLDGFVNGARDTLQQNTGTLTNVTSDTFALQQSQLGGASNGWYDNIFIDDGADNSDTGDVRVGSKRPFANGTTNGFTTQVGSGGSGYGSGHAQQVNEQPLSQTNGWSLLTVGSAVTEEYNIEKLGEGDVDLRRANIIDTMGWVQAAAALSETAQMILNGVTANVGLTSSPTLFFQPGGSSTYPAGSGADIGLITSTLVTTVTLYECGVLVAYFIANGVNKPATGRRNVVVKN